ncbi:CCA tRNA nucleotidyltransferase [Psychroflexus sp. MBR-150]
MMSKHTEALTHPIFKIISEVADELSLDTYVIGGYVRDYFLNKQKVKDIDIVCVGNGIHLAEQIAKALGINKKQVKIFKRFGTAMLHYKGIDIEFVGARKESYAKDSRNPEVEPGSLEDDQNRRDFTINALALQLNSSDFGQLLDPFDGIQDLKDKVIKTPLEPEVTFSDDPLRMMRAVRFSSQLHFQIEEQTFKAIQQQAERLKIVSPERIIDEFNKIMMTPKPSFGLKLLLKANLLKHFLPELTALQGVDEVEGQTHKENFWHTLEVVDNISENTENLWLRWAALLHDIGKAPTKRFDKNIGWTFHGHEFKGSKMVYKLFKRLKMPLNEKMKYVQKLVFMSSRPIAVVDSNVTDSAVRRLIFDAGDDLEDLMTLCEADITTKNPKRFKAYHNNFKRVRDKIKDVEERDHIRNFQPPISGEEIMKAFNIKPSKEIGIIKSAIKEAILEGEIPNEKEAAREFMLQKGKELGLKPDKN